jgi:mono/diheme cytochrome c family protein
MTWKIATAAGAVAFATLVIHGLQAASPTPPPGPALSLISERCVSCHTTDTIFSQRKTAADWTATVQTMADRGADVSPDEMATIASYLAQNFPAPTGATTPAGAVPAGKPGPG